MLEYILCRFEYGYEGDFFQEIFNGEVIRMVDLDGNTLVLNPPYGYNIINANPDRPIWAQ